MYSLLINIANLYIVSQHIAMLYTEVNQLVPLTIENPYY